MASVTEADAVVRGIEAHFGDVSATRRRRRAFDCACATTRRLAKSPARCSRPIGDAHAGRAHPDGGAGLLLQRHLLHLRADPDQFLRHAGETRCGWYILPFAAGNVLGPILLGRLFDTVGRRVMIALDLRNVGHLACRDRLSVQPEPAHGAGADRRLDDRLLFRLRGGKLGLPHGERNFPAGDACACHRVLLCDRHRRRAASSARCCSAC